MARLKDMKLNKYTIVSQFYVLPFVKITHELVLNGSYELIIGWLNIEVSLSYEPKQKK